jgi:hypothetical protein
MLILTGISFFTLSGVCICGMFYADLAGAYNILITPSPERDRGNGPKTRPETKPSGRGDVVPNLSALAGTFALQGGEEVRI